MSRRTQSDALQWLAAELAVQRHQILFSCHPEDWRDLGVVPRNMDQLRG